MTDEVLKNDIASWLRSQGLEVTPLERREQKTPDLLAKGGGDEYLIEIKTKQDDARQLMEEAARLDAGEVVTIASRWGSKNVVSGIVKEGVDQMASFGDASTMRILWLHAVGRDHESQAEQFLHTLYGATNIIDIFDRTLNRQCYYFYDSSFYRFRSKLDGAVVSRITGQTKLLLNSLSPQHERLSCSCLVRAFGGAVVDPAILERAGNIMIADCDIDRNNSGAVKSYLQNKYSRPALDHIHVGRYALMASTSLQESENDERDER